MKKRRTRFQMSHLPLVVAAVVLVGCDQAGTAPSSAPPDNLS